jgi:predicted NodU family carbamoyl transferase
VSQKTSYLGNSFTDKEIEDFLKKDGIPFEKLEMEEIPPKIAELIAGENV